jgi:hypothetical protein
MWGVDAMAEAAFSFSPFAYAFNNPIMLNDPSGLFPLAAFGDYENERKKEGMVTAEDRGNGGGATQTGFKEHKVDSKIDLSKPVFGHGAGQTAVFSDNGELISGSLLGLANVSIKVGNEYRLLKINGRLMSVAEFIHRVHWAFGEAGEDNAKIVPGSDNRTLSDFYAFTIQNLSKSADSEHNLYNHMGSQKLKNGFMSGDFSDFKSNNYGAFSRNPSNWTSTQKTISSSIIASILGTETDPTGGANQWRGKGIANPDAATRDQISWKTWFLNTKPQSGTIIYSSYSKLSLTPFQKGTYHIFFKQ